MKISNLSTNRTCKRSLLAGLIFTLFTSSSSIYPLHAQTIYTTRTLAEDAYVSQSMDNGIPDAGLKVMAYPLDDAAKLKVKFTNATGKQILLLIKNETGREIYRKFYPQSTYFEGIFNLSLLENGKYTLQVSTLTKAGFIGHSYKQAFYIQSQLKRSITPTPPAPEKELITLGIE